MASLAAAVAGLTRGVEWAAVGGRAVAGDVAQLAASIALHSLSLAVACKVVRSTALVASGRTASSESTPEAAVSTTGSASSTSHSSAGVRAVACQVAGEATGIASSACASSAQAQRGAVSLNVAKALAVVALLGLGGAGVRASVGLVAGLLAWCTVREKCPNCVARDSLTVVAEPLRRRAHLCRVTSALCSHGKVAQLVSARRAQRETHRLATTVPALSLVATEKAERLTSVVSYVSALKARTTR